jgi:RHS repeat-associated protein
MIRLIRVLTLLIFLALISVQMLAQVQTGTPAFGSFGGGPDVINLANLNSHLTIPILNKPGRGLNFQYNLTYDSSVWYPAPVNGRNTWQPVFNFGWIAQTAIQTGYLSYFEITQTCDDPQPPYHHYYIFKDWIYYDPWGGSHPFHGQMEYDPTNCDLGTTSTLGALAADGSGYSLSAAINTAPTVTTHTVTTSNGQVVVVPLNLSNGYSGVAATATDRNGNQITVNSTGSSATFTDTLGTTAITVTGTGTTTSPLKFTYTPPSGGSAYFQMNFTNYTVATNFSVTGVSEYKSLAAVPLVTSIALPDSSQYNFTYEPTPGACTPYSGTTCTTARIASITLSTGGTISYTYTGIFSDGSTAGLKRYTPDTGSSAYWSYARTHETGAASVTTITDPTPQANQTVVQFQGIYETQRDIYQGAAPTFSTFPIPESTLQTANLLKEIQICYNANTTNCTSTAISTPIIQRNITTHLSGASSWANSKTSQTIYKYSSTGSLSEQDDYDYGSGSPGSLLKKTAISYAPLTNITAFRKQVTVSNGTGATVSQTTYNYGDTVTGTSGTPQHTTPTGSRGNLLSVNYYTQGSTALTKSYTYFDTGNVQTVTDVNGAQTTYAYGPAGCPNSFPTSVAEPLSLSRSMTWNCTGGVQTSVTDENGRTSSTTYASDAAYWRPDYITDQLGNQTTFYYAPNSAYPTVNDFAWSQIFNTGTSETSDIRYSDGLGRVYVDQRQQQPNSSTLDSVSYTFDSNGRPYSTSMPCSIGYAGTCSTPKTTTTYDALNRVAQITDGGGGTITNTFTQNDVKVVRGPAPTGENSKQHQSEYDALGRLTSVCEMTSVPGSGACGQNTPQTGFWTKYSYDPLGSLTGLTQNAQASTGTQSRSYVYDLMGRMTSETNPESGTTTYVYDVDSTCGTSTGDLVKRTDAVGNVTCYSYDALHRALSVTYPSGSYASKTPNKYFVYDSATVNSVSMANGKTRLVEAYTASSQTGTKITDLGISYTVRGEPSDGYESTPNSAGYYHVGETYWANGALNTLIGPSPLPTFTFTPDGEGRISVVSASSGQNPVTNTAFNSASLPTSLTFGSTDSDSFTYDPNTERMTQYQFNVNGTPLIGALGWNANGSLVSQNITDGFNAADNQACGYVHDDLVRLASVTCTGQFLQDPGFESGLSPYWSGSVGSGGSFQLITDPTRAHSGNSYVQLSSPSGSNGASVAYTADFQAQPGNQITFGGWVYLESGGGGGLGWWIAVKDANHTPITYVGAGTPTTSGWQFQTTTYTLPSGAAYVDLYAQVYQPSSSTVLRVDDGFLGDASDWSQTFSYDAFGNISKNGSATFAASYNSATNQISSVGGFTPTYDANGNTLTDPAHAYSWDSAGKPVTIDSVNMTYDALGRMVEQNQAGVYTQFVYGPHGGKLAIMSGQTLQKAIIPLVGGAQAVYNASGLLYYGHSDHLGSIRLGSTPTRTMSFDIAYAPFGETYASSGSTDPAFTGQRQDTVTGLFDFPAREYSNEGRWPSPDPAGITAFHLVDPQSLNRYAYVRNTPMSLVDLTGLDECTASADVLHVHGRHIRRALEDSSCGNGGVSGGGGGIGGGGDPTSGGDPGNSGGGCGPNDPACIGNSNPNTGAPDPLNNPLSPSDPNTVSASGAVCEYVGLLCDSKTLIDNLQTDQTIFNQTQPYFYDPILASQTPNGAILVEINQLESVNLLIDNVALGNLSISVLDHVPGADLLPPGVDHALDLGIDYFETVRDKNNQQIDQLIQRSSPPKP